MAVQPVCVRRDIVEMNVLVPRQPHVPFRLMRAEAVHNDMDFPVRMGIDYAVHKIQKLYPSAPLVMPSHNMTGGRFRRERLRLFQDSSKVSQYLVCSLLVNLHGNSPCQLTQ